MSREDGLAISAWWAKDAGCLEDCELALQRDELRYAGRPVTIEPQVFRLLADLIGHRDHVVRKEGLLEQ